MARNSVLLVGLILAISAGCLPEPTSNADPSFQNNNDDDWITSEKSITVENGQLTEGRPKVTLEVEKQIYTALNYRRKMIHSIKQGSGSARGLKQMQEELELLKRSNMTRYDLTRRQIDAILAKGDAAGWE